MAAVSDGFCLMLDRGNSGIGAGDDERKHTGSGTRGKVGFREKSAAESSSGARLRGHWPWIAG